MSLSYVAIAGMVRGLSEAEMTVNELGALSGLLAGQDMWDALTHWDMDSRSRTLAFSHKLDVVWKHIPDVYSGLRGRIVEFERDARIHATGRK